MKKSRRISVVVALATAIVLVLVGPSTALAVTATVNLRTADSFAILAGTPNITDTPTSSIFGNVGLSPATGAGIGLLSTQVNGTIYAVDAFGPVGSVNNPGLLTIAKNDLVTAYNDAAGRTPVTIVGTELGGQTLTDGVYGSNSTTFGITAGAGPLVLDGQGNPNSVFIFEAPFDGTGLTVGPGSIVSLINQAQACKVFWRVNTAAINTTAVFKGTILALTSITVANGANIEGRLLARNGNVTLINDRITRSDCILSPSPTPITEGLPYTGIGPGGISNPWNVALLAIGMLAGILIASIAFIAARRKKEIG
ncbi:MAG: ice-binding family protein [Actinomycetota bacterium]